MKIITSLGFAMIGFFYVASDSQQVHADSSTYVGTYLNNDWSVGSNWSTGAAPGSTSSTTNSDTATFSAVNYPEDSVIVDEANLNIGSIVFSSSSGIAMTIYDEYPSNPLPLLLSSGGSITDLTVSQSGIQQDFDAPIVLEAASATSNGTYSFINGSSGETGGSLYFTDSISGGTTTGTISLNLIGNSTSTITPIIYSVEDNVIAGTISNGNAAALTVAVTGTSALPWLLTAANTYTGATTLDGSPVVISTLANGGVASGIGASSNAASSLIFGGGTLIYNGSAAASTDRLFTIGDANGNSASIQSIGTGSATVSFTNTGTISFANSATHTLTLGGSTNGENLFAPTITDQSPGNSTTLNVTGSTWMLTGANTYTGLTTVSGGELDLNTTGGLAVGGSLAINYGTVKLLQANQISSSGSLTMNGGTLNIQGFNQDFASVQLTSGLITGTGGTLYSAGGYTVGSGTITAALAGTSGFTLSGTGTSVLSGANTFTGPVALNSGVLNLGSSTALGASTNTLTFGGGTLQYSSANTTDYSSRIANSTGPIAIDTNGQNITFASALGGSNTGGLTKLGAGTLTLSGANAYSGTTTLGAGTLILNNSSALGNSGDLSFDGGTLEFTSMSSTTFTGTIVNSFNTAGGILINTNGQNVNMTSLIGPSNFGGLTKLGTGTLTLSGGANFAGTTTLAGGTLYLNSIFSPAYYTSNGPSTIAFTGGTLEYSSANKTDYSSIITNSTGAISINTNGQNVTYSTGLASSNTGGLTKLGLGTLTLSGANQYTGPTVIAAGTLQFSTELSLYGHSTGSWTASNITVGSGAMLDLNVGGAGQFTSTDLNTLLALGTSGTNGFLNGAIIGLDTTNASGGNFTYSGAITNASTHVVALTKLGTNTLTLGTSNTFSGAVSVANGTLAIESVSTGANTQSLGRGTSVTLGVSGGTAATLQYLGTGGTLDKNITASGNGTIQNSGTGALTLSGTLTKADTVLTLNGGTNGIVVSGQITGGTSSTFNSDLDIVGGSTTLSNANNNYTGPTYVYGGGTLSNGVTNALPAGTVLTLGNTNDLRVTNTYNLNGYNQTVAALDSAGNVNDTNVVTNNAASGTATLTLSGINGDGGSASSSYAATIEDGASATTALAVTGGTHTLGQSGNYTYSGGTTISSGTLVANGGGSLQFGTSNLYMTSSTGFGNVAVNSGGVLSGSGAIAPAAGNAITVASGGLINPGTSSGTTAQGYLAVDDASTTAPVLILQAPGGVSINNPQLTFNLGSGAATTTVSGLTFAGTSSFINLLSPISFGTGIEVEFNNNLISLNDLTGGHLADGDYLLFLAGSDSNYSGLTLGANDQILAGLSLTGTASGPYGGSELFLQDGAIYVDVVPEPSTGMLLLTGFGAAFCLHRLRRVR